MVSQACAGLLLRPGLGKTTTSYAAATILQEKKLTKAWLVVAPLQVAYNVWPKQCKEWDQFKHLSVGVLHGPRKEEVLKEKHDIYVINPEGLEWLFKPVYDKKKDSTGKEVINKKKIVGIERKLDNIDVLLVDESTKFKDGQTQRFALLRHVLRFFKRRYILTGTPAPKGLMDLWGQVYILDEGASLGRYITHYRQEYFHQSGYGGYEWTPDEGAVERVARRIAPLVIQIDHTEYLKMPKLLPPNDIIVTLPEKVMKMYREMARKLVAQVQAGEIVAANAAVASSKLRQICQGALYTDGQGAYEIVHTEKLDALADYLEQMQGNPVLIPYVFQFDRDMIQTKLKIPCLGANAIENGKLIEQFRAGHLPALIGHPATISLGLDGLQDSCSNICWYGIPWSLLHYTQTIDRVWRQGSRAESVQVTRILADAPIDYLVTEVLDDREATEASFLKLLGALTAE